MPTTPSLPTPDFTFDPDLPGACIAGVRPYRNGSYRLDAETISDKFIVHNYGHGGAGITLSWGCAAKVRDIVKAIWSARMKQRCRRAGRRRDGPDRRDAAARSRT